MRYRSCLLLLWCMSWQVAQADEPPAPRLLADMARPVTRPGGFPKRSAVCFSTRTQTAAGDGDHDLFQSAADFHVTGFYWCHGNDRALFQEISRRGYPFQGWLSTILPDSLFGRGLQKGRIHNEQGELVTAPWMQAFRGWWGCVNSPEYREVYVEYARMYVDAGADSLQMDDPGANATAVKWGGCYCQYCREKAAQAGKTPPEIQEESTLEFYQWAHQQIDDYAGRHIPFSCNSHPGDKTFYDIAFDFGLTELQERDASFESVYRQIRRAEELGKAQMFTLVSTKVPLTRSVIALAYATGSQVLVPWDVYIATGAPRYFSRPEDYADLYGFARAAAEYLDDYEDAAVSLHGAPDRRYRESPFAVRGAAHTVSLFARAKPGDKDAPVVIHCLDASDNPQPFHLDFDPMWFFGGRPLAIDFVSPVAYDRDTHRLAEQSQDFRPLAETRRLAAGYVTRCEVPAVAPWGLIVIRPVETLTTGAGLWPPSIIADVSSRAMMNLTCTMNCASPGVTIRFTVDGREPSSSSAAYRKPLKISSETTVKARAFVDGDASAVTTVTFTPINRALKLRTPDTVRGVCLWLRASDLSRRMRSGDRVTDWPAAAGPSIHAEKMRLVNGKNSTPPTWFDQEIHGQPGVRFSHGTDQLAIPQFANEYLTGAFSVFMVSLSDDSEFGASGNGLNGNGGVPRLFFKRDGFAYNNDWLPTKASRGSAAIYCYCHDGNTTAHVYIDGKLQISQHDPKLEVVGQFGGGNFAIPFWSSNQYHAGSVGEIVVFNRLLKDAERQGIEQYLSEKFQLGINRLWE